MTILSAAKAFVARGVSVVPVRLSDKKATVAWARFQKQAPSSIELAEMFDHAEAVAAICGAVSGCLECIDFDDPALFPKWEELVREGGHAGLLERLVVQRTKRGGFHTVYRCADGVEGNQKLARHMGEREGRPVAVVDVETRGEGGYFVAWPSPGYSKVRGTWNAIPTIDRDERDVLLSAARMLSDMTARAYTEQSGPTGMRRPGDEFAERTDWAEILTPHGWTLSHERGGESYWVRPGKTKRQGAGATTNYRGSGLLKVFTSNGHPFEPDATYTKFAAWCHLEHGGDFMAGARALGAKGFGDRPEPKRPPQRQALPTGDDRGAQRWVSLDMVETKKTDWLVEPYVPLGEVTLVAGDPGEGKSTLMQAFATAVTLGTEVCGRPVPMGRVVFLSAEQSLSRVTKPRFEQMGADCSKVVCPDDEEGEEVRPFVLDEAGIKELRAQVVGSDVRLIVVDTVTAYIEGQRDFNTANSVREWMRRLAEIARAQHCALVVCAHCNKNTQAKPLYRIQGSIDFVGASRSVLMVGHDPDDDTRKAFTHEKSNVGPKGPGIAFSLKDGMFGWIGQCDLTAERMYAPPADRQASLAKKNCAEWLEELLKDGPVESEKIEAARKECGHSRNHLFEAKKMIGAKAERDKFGQGGKWFWYLPGKEEERRWWSD